VARRHVNGLTSQYTHKLCVAVSLRLNGRTRRAWTVGVLTPGASQRIDVVGRGSIDGRAQGGAAGRARAAEVRGSRGAGKQEAGCTAHPQHEMRCFTRGPTSKAASPHVKCLNSRGTSQHPEHHQQQRSQRPCGDWRLNTSSRTLGADTLAPAYQDCDTPRKETFSSRDDAEGGWRFSGWMRASGPQLTGGSDPHRRSHGRRTKASMRGSVGLSP